MSHLSDVRSECLIAHLIDSHGNYNSRSENWVYIIFSHFRKKPTYSDDIPDSYGPKQLPTIMVGCCLLLLCNLPNFVNLGLAAVNRKKFIFCSCFVKCKGYLLTLPPSHLSHSRPHPPCPNHQHFYWQQQQKLYCILDLNFRSLILISGSRMCLYIFLNMIYIQRAFVSKPFHFCLNSPANHN